MGYKGKKKPTTDGDGPPVVPGCGRRGHTVTSVSLSPGGLLSGLDGELMGNRNETYLRYKNLLFVVT